jgi:hypothetical protein
MTTIEPSDVRRLHPIDRIDARWSTPFGRRETYLSGKVSIRVVGASTPTPDW